MAERAMRIGLVGLGTIGTGVVRALASHGDLIAERLGFRLELARIADIDLERDRGVPLAGVRLTKDWREIVNDPDIDLVVELIGGTRVAREVVLAALDAGKSVVTANKALLATHGAEVYALAASKRTEIAFEASVGGTIPVLRALREGLCADRVKALHGIVNGTCNFILTQMEAHGEPYEVCLKRAQELGYAEPDPSFDVDGVDSAHKLAILAGLAFGARVAPDAFPIDGIRRIVPADIEYARRIGLRIKLLAVAKRSGACIEARVQPTMIPRESVLAGVDGSMNAIEVRGELSGPTLYYGAGAGALPTASAVLSDLMELARARRLGVAGRVPPLGTGEPGDAVLCRPGDERGEFYVRFTALDKPGVLSRITGALGARGISIASVLQEERHESRGVPIVLTVHEARQADLDAALADVARLPEVVAPAQKIRIEREL
ncbi:MAG TPA: homoserine dehydrogenase [Myxococcota bacterium]|nr:homoserine dehydrogenase [Myxococcota bacterium]